MAEMAQNKSKGLKFAEEQLLRHGWEKGKGLGRTENGITEAIKVRIKCDKGGVGHNLGEQFTFHWWDHVFNKASSGLVVESGQNDVVVKKSSDDNDDLISNKRPRKAQQNKSMLYGCFVKSATLLSGEKRTEKTDDSDDSSSSSSEDEDQNLDLSSTTKLSDEQLLKACGGRTAHKGARHGLTMSAKLARLEQQDQEFMNKYGKKNHTAKSSTSSRDCLNPEGCPDMKEKTKHKKSKRQEEPSENNIREGNITHILSSNDTEGGKAKRKDFNDASANDDMIADTEPKKKKRNRKEKEAPEDCVNGDCSMGERDAHLLHKKKKKKRSKVDEMAVKDDEINEDSTDKCSKQPQESSTEHQQASDSASRKKKNRKKSSTEHNEDVNTSTTMMTVTEDTSNEAQVIEGQENDRKKKKKKKRSKKEEQEVVENVQFEESVPKKKKKKKEKE
ncbi:G patch domain-containing protein 4 isoform X1 [Puntigrus tetrazona]|uniref:G patch domain-containing protein 4 isoform X1 n=1 Tax=Puntigrus tetrazona TaxID=1606681 RepID=UPI001C8AF9BA|nr:G patch domain-containing protein 4 isoform X1 [Puntigrus tetrazona]XP_043116432.1 G patch domain-containing protein 4 isoform X1 [Puntigrus tetrazona]